MTPENRRRAARRYDGQPPLAGDDITIGVVLAIVIVVGTAIAFALITG